MSYPCVVATTFFSHRPESPIEDQCRGACHFVAFSDVNRTSGTWEMRRAACKFRSAERNARAHKTLLHHFIEADVSVWVEPNVQICSDVHELANELLSNADMALFEHPRQRCCYDEAVTIATRGMDDPRLVTEQMEYLRRCGFPAQAGLCETRVVIRRHSASVQVFNALWFEQVARYSVHDHLGIMYAARAAGVRVRVLGKEDFDLHFKVRPRPAWHEPY